IRLSAPQPLPDRRRWWHGNKRREAERAAAGALDQEPPTSDDIRPIAERGRHALGRAEVCRPGPASPVTTPGDRQEADTLLPGQVEPVTDEAADRIQREATESLLRSGANPADLEALAGPRDETTRMTSAPGAPEGEQR